jgi:hypothetical protein
MFPSLLAPLVSLAKASEVLHPVCSNKKAMHIIPDIAQSFGHAPCGSLVG